MLPSDLQVLLDCTAVHRALRLRLVDASTDGIVLAAEAGAEHEGADGSQFVHGGVVATVLDSAATFALIAATDTDWSTVDLRIDYVRPVPVGVLRVRGTVVHIGRRLGRATAELVAAGSERLLASAAGTFVRAAPEASTGT
jgi:uncharacterized protein (TIGR00369 family)